MVKGFGSLWVNEPTHLCDLLNTIEAVPEEVYPTEVNNIMQFIKKINPDLERCQRHKESYCSFITEETLIKSPDVFQWLNIVKLNLHDAIIDLKHTIKGICNAEETIHTLESLLEDLRNIDFSELDVKRINQSIKTAKQKEYLEQHLTEKQLSKEQRQKTRQKLRKKMEKKFERKCER